MLFSACLYHRSSSFAKRYPKPFDKHSNIGICCVEYLSVEKSCPLLLSQRQPDTPEAMFYHDGGGMILRSLLMTLTLDRKLINVSHDSSVKTIIQSTQQVIVQNSINIENTNL
jgi:hypothetical protein